MSGLSGRPASSYVRTALDEGRLGLWRVVAIVMAAAAPLTVVAGGATTGYAITGVVGIPLAYVVVGMVLALFAVGYVAMSRRLVNAGAFYTYVSAGLGRVGGVGTSFVAVLAYAMMQIGLFGGFGAVFSGQLATWFGWDVSWWVCAFGAWALIAVLGALRIDLNSRVLAIILAAEVGIAAVYAVVQLAHPAGGSVSVAPLNLGHIGAAGFGAALVMATAGFVGFEGTAVFSEESKDPRRTVARATYTSLLIIGVLYGLCAWAMAVAAGPDRIVDAARTHGTELIFHLSGPYLPAPLVEIGHALFVTSLFAALLSFHNTTARYLFALGRERVLPPVLGRTSRRTMAPIAGSVTMSVVAAIVLTVYAIQGWDPLLHLFFWVSASAGLGILLLMLVTSVAVVGYFARPAHRRADVGGDRVTVWQWCLAPAAAAVLLTAIVAMTLDQFHVLLGVAPTSPWRWIFPGAFAAAGLAGIAWGALLRAMRPDIYPGIGRGPHSATPDTDALRSTPAGVNR